MADFHEAIRQPQPPKRDIWSLPRILAVQAVRRRYREPRVSYRRLERVEHFEAVEILVQTDGPFPTRALAPVLYVGDERVDHWERAGKNAYRFFALEPERVRDGAPIALGWPDDREPRQPADARLSIERAAE
jgi:hypothetical protein